MEIRPLSSWLGRDEHPGARPSGPSAHLPGTRPASIADTAQDGVVDPLRVAEIEANAPTVMIDPTGTPADLRAGLMRLGDKLREHERGTTR